MRKALLKFPAVRVFLAVALVLLVSGLQSSAANNDWFARAWQSDEGLPDNNVSGIAQTPDGFLWVGTVGGLVRFDGTRFDEFSPLNVEGVPSRGIRTVMLDKDGVLWLSMDRGIVVRAKPHSARAFNASDGLSTSQVQIFAQTADGAVWMGYDTRRSIACYKDGHISMLGAAEGVPGGHGWIAVDSKGELWLAKGGHLSVFRHNKFQPIIDFPQASYVRMVAARSGGVWIASGSRLMRYQEGGQIQTVAQLPPRISVSALLEDHTGAVWIGTLADGLFRCDQSGNVENMPSSHSEIECLFEGLEGNIWVGTYGGGLDRLRPRAVELLSTDQGLPFETIRSVTQDSSGAMWVVTQNGLLARNQGTNWSILSQSTNWPGGFCYCVAGDSDGAVWIGTTEHGLYRYQNGQYRQWQTSNHLSADFVHGILVSRSGDVWLNFANHVQCLHDGKLKTFDLPRNTRYLRAMAEDASGAIWGASSEGRLFSIKNGELTDETQRVQGNGAKSIHCLHATSDGALWIGYAGAGLGRFKNGKYACITTREGLHDNFISQIVADKLDHLWLAGNAGIFQVSMEDVSRVADDLAAGRKSRLRSVVYGRAEGLPSLQPTYDTIPAAIRSRDGRVWIAMRTGLAVVHSENIHDNPTPPPVLVERILVDGQPIAVYDSKSPLRDPDLRGLTDLHLNHSAIAIKANYRRLEIDYTALSFLAPENVNFRYRLEGVDDDWTEAGTDRKAAYAHLSSGNYTFHVIACNNSGVWNEVGAELHFTVEPFFWERWYFQLAVLVLFTLSIIAIVRYVSFRRLRNQVRVLEQQAVVHKERARIAKDIHDDLGANLTQITLLSELARQDMAAPEKAGGHVDKISSTARQVMKSLDEIVWAVNPRNDTLPHLVDYLGQFTLDFLRAPGIRCRLDLPEHPPELSVPADIRHNLFLAVKEALNNIVKHSGARQVRLGVDVSNGKLLVVVTDDGQGFEKPPQDAWADGLRNMRQRMAEIGGDCTIESHAGTGTTIAFAVPWRN